MLITAALFVLGWASFSLVRNWVKGEKLNWRAVWFEGSAVMAFALLLWFQGYRLPDRKVESAQMANISQCK